ncbi:Dabb family protein [Cupriavidus pinatubonensis]|uniref:Dabb family protein n=1 Tax=Cupriavidus pinatubonensis TaxID=248026 RepID=UPI0036063FD6
MMAFNKQITTAIRRRIEECFENVGRDCEGVKRFDLVDNQSQTTTRYTHALLSIFSSEQMLNAYRSSAAHDNLMAELGPHIEEIVVLDSNLTQGELL